MDVARLKAIPLFARFSEEELQRIAPLAVERSVPEGTVLVNGDGGADELLLIDEGTAEVWRGEHRVADLGAGDYFVPGATVVASSPVRLIALDIEAARRLALTA
jgi:CRP-like cAMP-binding protein